MPLEPDEQFAVTSLWARISPKARTPIENRQWQITIRETISGPVAEAVLRRLQDLAAETVPA